MPAKKIPKKKLACATKETKNGKEYTTCYEKKKTPARTFRVKKKVAVEKKPKPKDDDSITILGGKRAGIDEYYVKNKPKLIIEDVDGTTVDINFLKPTEANKYEFIGTAKIKDLVKTKTGWSVQASKVKNRGTSFWADSGM